MREIRTYGLTRGRAPRDIRGVPLYSTMYCIKSLRRCRWMKGGSACLLRMALKACSTVRRTCRTDIGKASAIRTCFVRFGSIAVRSAGQTTLTSTPRKYGKTVKRAETLRPPAGGPRSVAAALGGARRPAEPRRLAGRTALGLLRPLRGSGFALGQPDRFATGESRRNRPPPPAIL